MKIENITNQKKYTKPEDIPYSSFFYDEIGECLYYITTDDYLITFNEKTGISAYLVEEDTTAEKIESFIDDCSKIRLIDNDDVKLTYKFKE